MTKFKLALAAAALSAMPAFLPAFATPAAAIDYPWCAQYGGPDGGGGRNCGFVSYQQCMLTVSGIGGFCEQNSFYNPPPTTKRKRHSARD